MKTKYFYDKISIYSVLGLVALLATSCGSYQSTSYHDRDGIYGSTEKGTTQTEPVTRKDYFGAYRLENNETFTDVENYSTSYDVTPSAVAQESTGNYGGWGDDTEGVTVNVYGGNWPYWGWNNYWYGSYWGWNSWIGPSWGIGWGYPFYGYYGWGYPYYGWGWNNYYGGWNHHHHNNHYYSYNGGRRNYYYNNGSRGRNYSTGTRNNSYSTTGTRTYTPRTNTTGTRETTAPRQYNNNNNNTNYSTPRSTAPTRTYSPSSSGTRSSGSSSSGGGSYGGSSGGSRGGGRR